MGLVALTIEQILVYVNVDAIVDVAFIPISVVC